jgi:lipopolysaccharide/colanic/teichoic acid biosynthesis glycosyltransferase
MDRGIINQSQVHPYPKAYKTTKRVIDIVLSVLALGLGFPILIACAIAIRLDSVGSILLAEERIGKDGKRFYVYKFRTSFAHYRSDTKAQQVDKPIQEPQVTRVGRILRKTGLDELPQILNVLKGEMSLVGPRPGVPWEVEEYELWYSDRLSVLPGITGLTQVYEWSSSSFDRIVQCDLEYIEKRNILMDLEIMWRTIIVGRFWHNM